MNQPLAKIVFGGEGTGRPEQTRPCDFCGNEDAIGFVERETLGGKKTKATGPKCAALRKLKPVSFAELRQAQFEQKMLGQLRSFVTRLFSAPTHEIVPGVSSEAAFFSCQAPNCVCRNELIDKDLIPNFPHAFFIIENVQRADAARVVRAFVACKEFVDNVVKIGHEVNALPLAECDVFIEDEPPLTIGVHKNKNPAVKPPELVAQVPIASPVVIRPPEPLIEGKSITEREPVKTCSADTNLRGGQVAELNRYARIYANELKSNREVEGALVVVSAYFYRLLEAHRYPPEVRWEAMDDTDRQEAIRAEIAKCPLHCFAWKRAHGMWLSLKRRHEELLQSGRRLDTRPTAAAKYICQRCQRGVGSLYVGDVAVGVKDGPEATDRRARCKACKKTEKREAAQAAAARRDNARREQDRQLAKDMGCGRKVNTGGKNKGGKK